MKKDYKAPVVEITAISSEDIITASSVSGFKTTENGGSLKFGDGNNAIDF